MIIIANKIHVLLHLSGVLAIFVLELKLISDPQHTQHQLVISTQLLFIQKASLQQRKKHESVDTARFARENQQLAFKTTKLTRRNAS